MDWYTAKSLFLSWFSDIRFYSGGFVLWGDSSYKIKGPHMRSILNVMVPGDVLLRRYNNYLGSVLIKGYWSHAAIYVGNNRVIHMLGEGIVSEDILTFMRCDDIMILRSRDNSKVENAILWAEKFLADKIQYDYNFSTSDNVKHYCTEFVDICFGSPIGDKKGFNSIIYPDDFMNSEEFFEVWTKNKG